MASSTSTARLTFRMVIAILVILLLFYFGRPLYWKVSETISYIRANKQTVRGGISQIVFEAQKSVGWFHDESDSDPGVRNDNSKAAIARRMLLQDRVADGLSMGTLTKPEGGFCFDRTAT